MLAQHFDIILELGGGWAIAAWHDIDEYGKQEETWIAIHIHDRPDYGYWLKRGNKCNVCGEVFPAQVVGMLNMFRGLQ